MSTFFARWLLLLLGLVAICAPTLAATGGGRMTVGFHQMTLHDPLDQQPMQAVAFYPAFARATISNIGPYHIAAGQDAPVAPGHYPLLVLSHGNSGSPLAQHDLATYLAKHGFVVLAVVHPGDNYADQSRLGTLSNLYGRPMQISQAITDALQDPWLEPFLDEQRIGMIGYSAGGETALIVGGAQPQMQLLRDYCQAHPGDQDACRSQGELVVDRDDLVPESDPRVKALMLLAPLSLMFGKEELQDVQVPVLMYAGDHDQLLAIETNALALTHSLPQPPDYRLLDGAGHFIFMSPCSAEQEQMMPMLCEDAEGVDRGKIHRRMNAEAVEFFSTVLGPDLADHQASLH
ncbi:putative dienelactone hydrolase [Pseudomonas sp. TE3786]